MNRFAVALLAFVAASLISGCGLWTRDKSEPPAPLPQFENLVATKVLWSRNTGAGSDGRFLRLSPFMAEDRIVVVDARGQVTALERDSGREIWRTRLDQVITGGVNGGDGRVVLGTGKGKAIALDLQSGQELWRRPLSSEVKGVSRISQGLVVLRTNDGRLHALDAATGEPVWTAGRSTPALSLRGSSDPLMLSGRVAAGFDNGRLVMFGLPRGNVVWENVVSTPSGRSELERMADVDADLVVQEGILYAVGYQGRVVAMNVADGRTLWQRDMSSYQGLALAGDMLFVTDAQSHVWALDRRNGATVWQQDLLRLRKVSRPVVLGEHVVVGDFEGWLHWLDPEDGSLVGRARGDRRGISIGLMSAGDVLYALGQGGELTALTGAGPAR